MAKRPPVKPKSEIIRLDHVDVKNITKSEIKQVAEQVRQGIIDGHADPVEVMVFAKKMSEFAKTVTDSVKDIANEKAKIGQNETLSLFNADVIRKFVKTEYDYGNCNDPYWSRLDAQIKELTESRKEREKFLQTLKKSMMICDESTDGEQVTLNPPIKYQTEGLQVTIRK